MFKKLPIRKKGILRDMKVLQHVGNIDKQRTLKSARRVEIRLPEEEAKKLGSTREITPKVLAWLKQLPGAQHVQQWELSQEFTTGGYLVIVYRNFKPGGTYGI